MRIPSQNSHPPSQARQQQTAVQCVWRVRRWRGANGIFLLKKLPLFLKPTIMRWILLLVLFGTEAPLLAQQKNPIYDSVLAAKLGADDYGMKKYVGAPE